MLRRFVGPAVGLCLMLAATSARAQFKTGDWTLSLGGFGTNGQDFDSASFSFNGDIGYFVTDQIEVAFRQSIGFTDFEGDVGEGSAWVGSSAIAGHYHFDMGQWQPYVGAAIGFAYGDVNDTGFGGPEGGVKFFVNETTYIEASVGYQWFFDSDDDMDDGAFIYGLNIGFRW